MLPFGTRKARPPEITQPETAPAPAQQLAAAEAALDALLAEQATVQQTLLEHQQQRQEWLRDGGDLQRVTQLDRSAYQLRLRSEQIDMQLPARHAAVQQAHAAIHEATRQSHRPALAAAEAELVEAIQTFQAALEHANALHGRARNFGERVREFATPPPPAPVYNDWSLRQYLDVVERRQQPVAALALVEISIEAPLHIPPPQQRFTPRRVPVSEIEAISPIAAPRRVRVLHGPVRTANFQIGIARMFPGETHTVPARAAHALVGSGCAKYADETATVAA